MLLSELANVKVGSGIDAHQWSLSNDGEFSVGSTRNHIDNIMLPSMSFGTRWNKSLPRKGHYGQATLHSKAKETDVAYLQQQLQIAQEEEAGNIKQLKGYIAEASLSGKLCLGQLLQSMDSMDQLRVNIAAKTTSPTACRVHSKFKSSCLSNNFEKLEEDHRNSLIPKTQKHKSSKCNNIKLAVRNAKSEVVCAMCKQCFVTGNHDVCMLNYVNDMNSRADNQSANVSKLENQKKHKANVKKSKELEVQRKSCFI
ncbi:hypothetical protein Tco_0797888 [Tanacetum coccineum]